MTDTAIQSVLDNLNGGKLDDIIVTAIRKDVSWGYVWDGINEREVAEGLTRERGFEFFFVRAKDGKFAAAVFRMGAEEMHWYVTEEYRGRGILVEPLRKVILPFIFKRYEENTQAGNIEDGPCARFSAKLARKVGFKCVSVKDGQRKFVLRRQNVPAYRSTTPRRPKEEDFRALQRQTNLAYRFTGMVFDRLRVQHLKDFKGALLLEDQVEDSLNRAMDYALGQGCEPFRE